MLKTDGRTGSSGQADESSALVEEVWSRQQLRLEKHLHGLERFVLALFERKLEDDEVAEAVVVCEALASRLGLLGFATAAELLRSSSVLFEDSELSSVHAVALSTNLDDVRGAMAVHAEEVKHLSHSGQRLAVVGDVCEALDNFIWSSASHGFATFHDPNTVLVEADAIVVVLEQPDLTPARNLLRNLRQMQPGSPIVLLAPVESSRHRLSVVDSVTTIMPLHARPADVMHEVRGHLARRTHENSVVIFGSDAGEHLEPLTKRGLVVSLASSADDLLEQLRDGRSRAVVLMPEIEGLDCEDVLRLIRSDREARPSVVVVIGAAEGEAARVLRMSVMREGADDFFDLSVDYDELAVSVKAGLTRRSELEPLAESSGQTGCVTWGTAVVLIERLIMVALRQKQTVGFGLLRLPVGDGGMDDAIAREFRGEDVTTRVDDEHLAVVLAGVDQRVLLRRINDLYRKFGLADLGVRSIGLEMPGDGRSLDGLLEIGREVLARACEEGAPALIAADWQAKPIATPDVLLIDPDTTLSPVLVSTLGRRGIEMQHRSEATAALVELTEDRSIEPKVVLMELDQRGIDGLQMLRRLRDAGGFSRFKVVLLTSRSSEIDLQKAFDLGAEDVVVKPFSTPILLHRLRRALQA